MKVVAFVVGIVLFLAGFWLFDLAFTVDPSWGGLTFFGGIAAIALSMMLAFHFLPSATRASTWTQEQK